MSILKAENIHSGYGKCDVLTGISLTVHPGEVLAIIGPNGAGKTTFIRTINRILKPREGKVLLNGEDIWEIHSRTFAREVARVEQTSKVTWPYTVHQIVQMGRFPHRGWIASYTKEDHATVDEVMRLTGLSRFSERSLNTLSGGEYQRAMVARALAQTPKVLILDEPVAHLDIKYKIAVLDLVRSLSQEGLAVVISLHDLNLASLYADKIALLAEGSLYAFGTPKEILTRSNLEEVYETEVMIGTHPANHRTLVTPVPSWLRMNNRLKRQEEDLTPRTQRSQRA
jgi:iron complex transport system ATP-binding protein